jgi:hypothetical protein
LRTCTQYYVGDWQMGWDGMGVCRLSAAVLLRAFFWFVSVAEEVKDRF